MTFMLLGGKWLNCWSNSKLDFFSTILYQVSAAKSNDEINNSIAKFLTNSTNDRTIYLIDQATTLVNVNIEKYVYGFWNKGNIRYVNAKRFL